jgi:hypothetical protein
MRDAVQGRNTSVRGTISKGRFVEGAQHPRTFGRGHIGQGYINHASLRLQLPLQQFQFEFSSLDGSDGGGVVYVRQNFTFQLVGSFWQTKFNSLPLPLKVEPLVRWGLQLCGKKDVG